MMSTLPKTSIIIPISNHNNQSCHYTGNCLGSIKEHTDPEKTPYEIMVVDNGSTVELGGWKWPEIGVGYVKWLENLGVSKAWNYGIQNTDGEFVAILNNDIMVFEHWLEDLQESLNHVQAVVGYPMYDCPWGRASEANQRREKWVNQPSEHYLDNFEDFCCFLTTRKMFDEIGLFDENFFAYKEDLDWKYRLREKGYAIKSDKRVNIHHISGATAVEAINRFPNGRAGWLENQKLADKYLKEKWRFDEYNQPYFIKTFKGGVI